MTVRFDELELEKNPTVEGGPIPVAVRHSGPRPARRTSRILAWMTDASLFAALGLAMSPLLTIRESWQATLLREWAPIAAFAAFLLMLSFYYFVISWSVWGRTIGGSIFDTRIGSPEGGAVDFRSSAIRWVAMWLSIATCGLGFLIAILPGGRSLADLMSRSRSFAQ